jgi:DNA uptake protein ComE-like DNA-binding protein
MKEIWKDVNDYEGYYEVSNLGRIRTVYRVVNNQHLKSKIKSLNRIVDGYLCVSLQKNGAKASKPVHRIVATAHIPNSENKPQVNHKNGNKLDNRVVNLEWNTGVENMRHAINTGLVPTKLTKEDVIALRINKNGLTQKGLAKLYGVSESHVHKIIKYQKWAWV